MATLGLPLDAHPQQHGWAAFAEVRTRPHFTTMRGLNLKTRLAARHDALRLYAARFRRSHRLTAGKAGNWRSLSAGTGAERHLAPAQTRVALRPPHDSVGLRSARHNHANRCHRCLRACSLPRKLVHDADSPNLRRSRDSHRCSELSARPCFISPARFFRLRAADALLHAQTTTLIGDKRDEAAKAQSRGRPGRGAPLSANCRPY